MLGRKIKIFFSSNLPSCSLKSQKSTKAAALVALVVMTPLKQIVQLKTSFKIHEHSLQTH